MIEHNVYRDEKYGHLYSDGVTRDFGENKTVLTDHGSVFSSIQPLKCDPEKNGLKLFGTIAVQEDDLGIDTVAQA